MMRTALLLSLLLLAGACIAQQDVDVEGLREILHRLVSSGNLVTSESLAPVLASFSGVEKELLAKFARQLESASEPEELLLADKIADLQTFKDLLFNLQSLGAAVHPKVAEAVLSVLDEPARGILQPHVAQWKQAGAVSLTDSFRSSVDSATVTIRQLLDGSSSSGGVRQRLRERLGDLPAGMARSMLVGIDAILERELARDASSPEELLQINLDQVDKVLNREMVQYLAGSMLRLSKAQFIDQLDILMRKVFDSSTLPNVFDAILRNLA